MSLPSRRPAPTAHPARTVAVLLPLVALVLGLLAGPAASGGAQAAQAATRGTSVRDEAAVQDSVAWLQRRVGRSTHLVTAPVRHVKVKVRHGKKVRWVRRSEPGKPYPDLSIDVVMALRRLDPGGATQAAMVRALQRQTRSYVSYHIGALDGRYADATARMLYIAKTSGVPVREYADGALRRVLPAMVRKARRDPQRGRVVDSGWGGDTSSTVSQAYAVQALAATRSRYLPIAAHFLAKQACPAGHFRPLMDSPDYTCKGSNEMRNRVSSADATALAILALRTARSHGVRHLDDEIFEASRWLAKQVRPSGVVAEDDQEYNARSTALAAIALKATGRLGPAGTAASWLLRHQVDARMIARHPALRGQRGAIAWDHATLVRAKRKGITRAQRKAWLRSTADAAPGLSALLPARRLTVGAVQRKGHLVVRLSGLVGGERAVLERDGKVVFAGRAARRGHVRVVLRKARHDVRLVAFGSRKVRTGVTVVLTPVRGDGQVAGG